MAEVVRLRGGPTVWSQDPRALSEHARALETSPHAIELLRARGIDDLQAQARVLQPRLHSLRPPEGMAGFVPAIELLSDAVRLGLRVGIFGDYDVDGVTTAAILSGYLEAAGVAVVIRVADRGQGYGLGVADARALVEAGAELVVTGDCGTTDHEALAWLGARGVPCIVIDHHQVPERDPEASAFINPHQAACGFPFKGLCSAGVAFYLCAGLRTGLGRAGLVAPDPRAWLDLVALGTVCDMVPLLEENRVLVHHGLRWSSERRRPGLRALLRRAGVEEDRAVSEEDLAFRLGPRLNAPGRFGAAEPSLRLLRARADDAEPCAELLESFNLRRKAEQERMIAEALALLALDPEAEGRAGLVVAAPGWSAGVVGLVAARLVEHYRRPALALALDRDRGLAHGSARSVAGIDVRAALEDCAGLLVRFGGHPAAAGVTVCAERLTELGSAFAGAVQRRVHAPSASEIEIAVDGRMPLGAVDAVACDLLDRLAPWGMGFPRPRYLVDDVVVDQVTVLKERHLRLRLRQGDRVVEAVAFGQAAGAPRAGDRVACLGVPERDRFRGQVRVRIGVERIWRVDDDTAPRREL